VRWAGDALVSPDLPAAGPDLDGSGITPGTGPRSRLAAHLLAGAGPTPPALVYPTRAAGTVWERRTATGAELARLLGRSRCPNCMECTTSPTTTTQLAARTGLSLGAVSQHLRCCATPAW
jgi:hypothetical protein